MPKFARPLFRWLRARLRDNLSLDLRALALMRVAFASLVIADIIGRSADYIAHYSDLGWLPREAAGNPPVLRAYFLSGEPNFVIALMVLTCVVAVSLMVGFRARLCAIACWFLVGSLHQRCWPVNQGGDDLMRNMLFFMAFTPLGARWSIDAWLKKEPILPKRAIGATTIILYGQLFLVYMVTGTMKASHAHWLSGEAVYHALSADHFVTEIGTWLYPHWNVLRGLTWLTLIVEIIGPLLLVLGPARAWFRGGLALVFVGFHIGIAATLHVGIFSAISASCWLFTLPTAWLDAVEGRLRKLAHPTVWRLHPSPAPLRWIATLAFSYILVSTVVEDRAAKTSMLYRRTVWPGNALGLKRRWALFVTPRGHTGWIVVEGRLADRRVVDFVRDRAPVSWEQPAHFYRVFRNQRWRKMLMRFRSSRHHAHTERYLQYLCRTNDDVLHTSFVLMSRKLGKRYDHGPVKRNTLGYVNCVRYRRVLEREGLTRAR